VCRDVKYEPSFCLDAPIGSGVGERWGVHLAECTENSDCDKYGVGNHSCGIDYAKVLSQTLHLNLEP